MLNSNNNDCSVYDAVIVAVAPPLWEFTRFIWWM